MSQRPRAANSDDTRVDSRLDAALEMYARRIQKGERIGPEDLIRDYPDIEAEIRTFFNYAERLSSFAHAQTLIDDGGALSPDHVLRTGFADYEILQELGQGGMGVVYKARQKSLNRTVALKTILAGRFSSAQQRERFQIEAEAAAKLNHPGIVSVYEVGQSDGRDFYSMAFVDGLSLADRLADANGPIAPRDAARLIAQVARAVQYAHENGVIHRDLKPANVIVDRDDVARVVDFGLAKQVETESGLTMTGQVIGTPSFMPPEQASGKVRDVGPESDIYAVGAVLYMLVTGRPPFSAANVAETLRQVIDSEPVAPRLLNSALPKDLETICLKCLQKAPAKRYESAAAVADELGRFLAGEPILARPIGKTERLLRWCRRNRALAALLAVLAIGVPTAMTVLVAMNLALNQANRDARAEHLRAEQSFRDALRAVNDQFTRVSEETLLDRPGLQPLRRDLLLGAQKYYEEFLSRRGGDPELRSETADVLFRLGVITEKLDTLDRALAWYTRAEELQTEVVTADASPDSLMLLSDIYNGIGRAHGRLEHASEAEAAFEEALKLREQATALAPDDIEIRRKLANARMNLGRMTWDKDQLQLAQSIRQRILRTAPGDIPTIRDLAKGYLNLAATDETEDAAEHEALLKQCIDSLQQVIDSDAVRLDDERLLATAYLSLANVYANRDTDNSDAIIATYAQAIEILNRLAEENPAVFGYRGALAQTQLELAYTHWEDNNASLAKQVLLQAEHEFDRIIAVGQVEYLVDYLETLWLRAQMEEAAAPRNTEAALIALRKARTAIVERLPQFEPSSELHSELLEQREKITAKIERLSDVGASPNDK